MVELENGYIIDCDNYQYILHRKYIKDVYNPIKKETTLNKEVDDVIGYFTDLPSAINRYVNDVVRNKIQSDNVTLLELANMINDLRSKIVEVYK